MNIRSHSVCRRKFLGNIFSYEERIVGKFVDGKPLYEKTFAVPLSTTANRTTYSHGIKNVDTIFINLGKSFSKADSICAIFPNVTYVGIDYSVGGSVTTEIIIIDRGNSIKTSAQTLYVTLNYTKTTD